MPNARPFPGTNKVSITYQNSKVNWGIVSCHSSQSSVGTLCSGPQAPFYRIICLIMIRRILYSRTIRIVITSSAY